MALAQAYRDEEGNKVRCSSIVTDGDKTWAQCCCDDSDWCCQDSLAPEDCKTTAANTSPEEAFCTANGFPDWADDWKAGRTV